MNRRSKRGVEIPMHSSFFPVLSRVVLIITQLVLFYSGTLSLWAAPPTRIRSVASGSWSSPEVWDQGQVPGIGSTVEISHAIVIDGTVTVGNKRGSVSDVLTVTASGSLRLAEQATLVSYGNIILDNAPLTLLAGAKLVLFQSKENTEGLKIAVGGPSGGARALLTLEGSATAPAIIQFKKATRKGAGVGAITDGGVYGGGRIIAKFARFDRLGSRKVPAITTSVVEDRVFSIANSRFFRSGGIRTANAMGEDASFELRNVIFQASPSSFNVELNGYNPLKRGSRIVSHTYFDREVRLYPPTGFSIDENIFVKGFQVTEGRWSNFRGNLVLQKGKALRSAGDVFDSYWLIDNPKETNPHFIQTSYYSFDETISGNIFEATGPGGDGDSILIGEPKSKCTIVVRDNIVLPNGANDTSGTLLSSLGNKNVTLIVEHNTYFAGGQGVVVGETYPGHPGMIASFRSNLAWDVRARGYVLIDIGKNNVVKDLVAASNVSHNAAFNIKNGSNGFGFQQLEFSEPFFPVGELRSDPLFFDSRRSFRSWAATVDGGAGSVAGGLRVLRENIERGGNVTPSVLMAWVKAGFVPTNPLFIGAGHDGATIGAVH